MTWKAKMGKATFRGVPFYVESVERSGGRRLVKHEYPGKSVPFGQDMGMRARSFPVEGHVVGTNYLAEKDALLDALELEGPGELVHPAYVGTRRVMVESYRQREDTRGGIASFSIDFFETPAQPAQPTSITDAPAKVTASAAAALLSVNTEFLSRYASNQHVDSISENLRAGTLSINNALSRVQQTTQNAAQMTRRINDFEDAIESLVSAPEDIVTGLTDILGNIGFVSALLEICAYEPGTTPSGTTPSRLQETENFEAVTRLFQRTAVINAALLAPDETYDSYDAALEARNAITDLLDEQAETVSDDVYPNLLQLRADLVQAVPGADSDLGRLVSYTAPVTVPSLVLAHSLYGNLDFESDLIARNSVAHPGFIIGGRALEVLSD